MWIEIDNKLVNLDHVLSIGKVYHTSGGKYWIPYSMDHNPGSIYNWEFSIKDAADTKYKEIKAKLLYLPGFKYLE